MILAKHPPKSLIKATRRLNPAVELDVDIVAVKRAVGSSTKEDWSAALVSLLEDFESYANTAALTPVWVETDANGICTVTLGTDSFWAGAKSIKLALSNFTGVARSCYVERTFAGLPANATCKLRVYGRQGTNGFGTPYLYANGSEVAMGLPTNGTWGQSAELTAVTNGSGQLTVRLEVRNLDTALTVNYWFDNLTITTGGSNVAVENDGTVRLSETGSTVLFQSGGTPAEATPFHYRFATGIGDPPQKMWLDFWPNPAAIGPQGFTLHSVDLVLGRKHGTAVFGSFSFETINSGYFLIDFARFDEGWRREVLGDPIRIPADEVAMAGGLVSINLRDEGRTVEVRTGRFRSRTGTGLDNAGNERTNDVTVEGDRKVSHIDVPLGFSIGVTVIGANRHGAFLGVLPSGTYPALDPTTFWRVATNRNSGPYAPEANGPSPRATDKNPGYGFLATGAVPGYGAQSQANGHYGQSLEVGQHNRAQIADATGWSRAYHVVRAVTYAPTGTVVKAYDLGATPTEEVHFRADASTPTGSSVTFTVRGSNDGSAWTSLGTKEDGAIFKGSELYRYYELTATLTAGAGNLTTPRLVAAFFTERVRFACLRYAREFDSMASIDPVTGQSEIGELQLPLLKLGRGDHRDIVTRIATEYAPTNVEAWVYIRETITGVRHFLNLYRLENRDPSPGEERFTFVSGMDRLKTVIPQKRPSGQYPTDDTYGVINSVTFNGTTKECTIGVTGTPFAGLAIAGWRYEGITGKLGETHWFIVASPAPTSSAFTIVLEDADQQPAIGDKFKLHSDTTERKDVTYGGVDFAAVYQDVRDAVAGLPQRFRGTLPPTTGRTVPASRLSAEGRPALEVLQDLAIHCSGSHAWRASR